jgi:hypothetical protein
MNIKGILKGKAPIESQLEKEVKIVGRKEKNIRIKGILKLLPRGG